MLTPVQQTPLPLDPVRQQITPTPPVAPPPPPQPAELPIQAGSTPQDKFGANGDGRGDRQDRASEDRQQAETAGQLRAAYVRLTELQQSAALALAAGDADRAKQAAKEAAEVAITIKDATNKLPVSNIGMLQAVADQMDKGTTANAGGQATSSSAPSAGSAAGSGSDGGVDVPAAIDLARQGLGAAIDVVNTAASVPYHPIEDRIAINGMRRQVLDAMAGVEAVASAAGGSGQAKPSATGHLDIKA